MAQRDVKFISIWVSEEEGKRWSRDLGERQDQEDQEEVKTESKE